MKKLKKVLAFVLAIGLMLSLLPPNMSLRAEESVATSITLQASDTRIHRSNVNKADTDGVKAYTADNGLAGNISNMTYDATNANRLAKVCIYNLKTLMTEPIGTSSDKGIGRYPYVVTKIKVNESGYYNIGTQINMRADGKSNTMVIMVDGVMHIVKTTLGSTAKQTVWKNNLYLSEGDHTVLYMAPIPQNVSDCPETADKYYYPWTNFWSFTFEKGSNNQSNTDIKENLKYLADNKKSFIIRIPLIPTVTDTEKNITEICSYLKSLGINYAELLPYNKMAGGKYPLAGKKYKPNFDTEKEPQPHAEIFEKFGISIKIM